MVIRDPYYNCNSYPNTRNVCIYTQHAIGISIHTHNIDMCVISSNFVPMSAVTKAETWKAKIDWWVLMVHYYLHFIRGFDERMICVISIHILWPVCLVTAIKSKIYGRYEFFSPMHAIRCVFNVKNLGLILMIGGPKNYAFLDLN